MNDSRVKGNRQGKKAYQLYAFFPFVSQSKYKYFLSSLCFFREIEMLLLILRLYSLARTFFYLPCFYATPPLLVIDAHSTKIRDRLELLLDRGCLPVSMSRQVCPKGVIFLQYSFPPLGILAFVSQFLLSLLKHSCTVKRDIT